MKKILGSSRAKELPKVGIVFQKVEIDTDSCYIIHVKNYFEKKKKVGGRIRIEDSTLPQIL